MEEKKNSVLIWSKAWETVVLCCASTSSFSFICDNSGLSANCFFWQLQQLIIMPSNVFFLIYLHIFIKIYFYLIGVGIQLFITIDYNNYRGNMILIYLNMRNDVTTFFSYLYYDFITLTFVVLKFKLQISSIVSIN